MGEHKHTLDELRQPTRALRERIPAVFDGYGQLSGAVFTDAALDAKTKELHAEVHAADAGVWLRRQGWPVRAAHRVRRGCANARNRRLAAKILAAK